MSTSLPAVVRTDTVLLGPAELGPGDDGFCDVIGRQHPQQHI